MTVSQPLILFFTDFGVSGPYLGQMEAAVMSQTLQARVINLMADAPAEDPRRASYLLTALTHSIPPGCIVVAVVDPGVGSERRPVLIEAGGRTFVGPDNGLLSGVARRYEDTVVSRIDWQKTDTSRTFHGRDLFAPVAALVSTGQIVTTEPINPESLVGYDWPSSLSEVVYTDHYGNAMTGLQAEDVESGSRLQVGDVVLKQAETFSEVEVGQAFWFYNSSGLVEIAVNQGRADHELGLKPGTQVSLSTG